MATDKLALQNALGGFGYAPAPSTDGFEGLTVRVPQGEAETLLSRLAQGGVRVLEARRKEESLESAYLRLVRTESRPS